MKKKINENRKFLVSVGRKSSVFLSYGAKKRMGASVHFLSLSLNLCLLPPPAFLSPSPAPTTDIFHP